MKYLVIILMALTLMFAGGCKKDAVEDAAVEEVKEAAVEEVKDAAVEEVKDATKE